MRLYSKNENYKLYQGNMLDMLEVIEPNTIDSIVTDPPYELNFMGKGWDNSGIAFQSDTWEKCYEVLKPGGYLLAFGGSRTFHRIACAIEDAGFEIRDTIMWLYGSGFPKSMDISKSLDKRNGRTDNDFIEFGKYLKEKIKKNSTKKDIAENIVKNYKNIDSAKAQVSNWELGKNIPTKQDYNILKETLDLDDRYDYLIEREEAEREVIGEKIDPDGKPKSKRLVNIHKDARAWNMLDTEEKMKKAMYITAPSTDLAKQWQGWGTALKPSFEPIIVARKPFKGSLVDNVIEYGVGGMNIDECRVGNEELHNSYAGNKNSGFTSGDERDEKGKSMFSGKKQGETIVNGRFPANTILTYDETDFDEVCGGFPKDNKGQSNARYFYCAKASKRDRDEGLDTFNQEKVNDGRQTPIDNAFQRGETLRKNTHPTVKPTELMQYLVRLVTPNNGTVLDPFNGSGSTGKAVMYENKERDKNYKYIGIELTEEYLPIAKARIEHLCNLKEGVNPQMSIFDFMEEIK